MKIKIALVGCGRIAFKHIEAITCSDDFTLVSVCDHDLSKFEYLNLDISVNCYSCYHDMLQKEEVDMVAILTESGSHFQIIMDILRYNKHIIVEKPLALKLEEYSAIEEAYKKVEKKVFVVKQNRYNRAVKYLKTLLDDGYLGKINLASVTVRWNRDASYYEQAKWRGTWANDGGALTNQAIHHVDLMRWMLGPVESVYAKTETFLSEIEAEDACVAILKFKSGILATLEVSTIVRPKNFEASIFISGSKGAVKVGGVAVNKVEYDTINAIQLVDNTERKGDKRDVYGSGHAAFYDAVYLARTRSLEPDITVNDAFEAMKIIHAIYVSSAEAREVCLSENASFAKLGESCQ